VPGLANTHPVAWKQLRAQHMSLIPSTCDALKMKRHFANVALWLVDRSARALRHDLLGVLI